MKIFAYIDEHLREDMEQGLPVKELFDNMEELKCAYRRLLQQRNVQRRYRKTDKGREKNRLAMKRYRDRLKIQDESTLEYQNDDDIFIS